MAAAAGATLLLGLLAGFAIAYLDAAWFATVPVLVWVCVLGGLAWRIVAWRLDRLALTDRRLLRVSGLIRPRVATVPLPEVTEVRYRQSRLGRALGYGTLVIGSARGQLALRDVPHLADPAELCQRIVAERALPAQARPPRSPGTRQRKPPAEDRTSA